MFILIAITLTLILPPLGFVVLAIGLAYYAYMKAQIRTNLRDQLNIPGTIMSDFILHCFCPCCAAAQEAREAKAKDAKALDFVYGEELAAIDFPQVERGGYVQSGSTVGASSAEDGQNASLLEHLKTISKLSHLILRLWLGVVVVTLVALLKAGRGLSIVVLLLVFLQPFLILYFVYWRDPEKSKHVSLDYVIKLFAVGFFMSTTQSIVFESILEGILGMVVMIVLVILNPSLRDNNDDTNNDQAQQITQMLKPFFQKGASWSTLLTGAATNTYAFLTSFDASSGSTAGTETEGHPWAQPSPYEPAPDGHIYFPLVTPSHRFLATNDTNDGGMTPEMMRKNFFIIVLSLLVMAFVIAAGVEETMKHFAVRCCRFPAPLRDPKSALIYLMTAALGFATSENIEYVFGANK